MIRRLNTLARESKTAPLGPAFLGDRNKLNHRQSSGPREEPHGNNRQNRHNNDNSKNGENRQKHSLYKSTLPNPHFRLFVQPFEVSALLRNRGELIHNIKADHKLYSLSLSSFKHPTASRSLRLKCDTEHNTEKALAKPKEARDKYVAKEADQLSKAVTDMYRSIIHLRPSRDADGMVLKPGTGQLRFSVTNSVASKFDLLCNAMNGGKPLPANSSISVNKQLIPEARDQLLIVNVNKVEDLDQVTHFVRELIVQEHNTPFNEETDLPRAHILPRNDINYHSHTSLAKRGQFSKIRLVIPDHMVGTVIGRGGVNIKELRERSGAFVSLKSEPGENSVVQIVSKNKDQVQEALVALKHILEQEWYSDKSLEEIEKIFLRAGFNL
ncbi:hypothetical protein CJU90_1195 [Yarrowia sp. C11]|nr:hypothetical protein CKK34_2608 [Yarrowia sp. E02]KAG5373484.1 hypothetical protein CJU90_1195 [Yarrowia sp. C11]